MDRLTQDNIDSFRWVLFSEFMSRNVSKDSGFALKTELLLGWGRVVFWGLFLTSTKGFGQSNSTRVPVPEEPAPKTVISMPSTKQKSVFGQVRFESMQYMTVLRDDPQLTNSQFLSGRVTGASYDREPFSFNWAADVSAGTFFSLRQSYYSVQELYVSTPMTYRSHVSLGRKKYDWTEIDRVWALGVWQPRYAIDALRPEDQGLTGLFVDHKGDGYQVVGFASPIFIPTIGPDIREEDGQLQSDNRWFRPPSSQAGNIDLTYELRVGDVWELMQQTSYALRVRVGDEDLGPWMGLAGGRKPTNDLLFQRCLRCVPTSGPAKFVVSPRVAMSDVVSADVGYQFETWKISASYFEDRPELVLPPPDFAVQRFLPVKMYAAQVDWNVREILGRPLRVQFGYLRSVGNEIQDIESNGRLSDFTLFEDRFRFTHAALASVMGEIMTIKARPLVSKLMFLREFEQEGSILQLEFQYQWDRTWSFLAGMDSLGVDNPESRDGFISDFRANDRIYAGASYVF